MNRRKIEIYDTTLRDGAQGMGVSFSPAGKLTLVRKLDELGVDYVEAGVAGTSAADEAFFKDVGSLDLKHTKVCAFGSTRRVRARVAEDEGVRRLLKAGTETITIFGKAWALHVRDVLRTSRTENLAMISDTVKFLKAKKKKVLFDAEHFFDRYKDNPAFAMSAIQAAVDAGCDTVILCDTNGGSLPNEVYEITSEAAHVLPVMVGVHTHNDSGMAVANTLEAVRAGARHVQGTINGYGERCGNADLCTVIPTAELKMGFSCIGKKALKEMRSVSVFVSDVVNLRHNASQPYVGANAFGHKAGMHVDAVAKNPRSFEHAEPESVGNERQAVLAECSGRSSVLMKAIEMGVTGVEKSSAELKEIVQALKKLESEGYAFEAADASFRMLVQKVLKQHRPFFELEGFRVIVEKRGMTEPCLAEATIKVRVKDQVTHTAGEGDGPVDALDDALRKALKTFYPEIADVLLKDYRVRILDPEEATAATTRVLIESSDGTSNWGTVGVSQNIIEASWEALVDSVEYKLFKDEEQKAAKSGARKKAKSGRKRIKRGKPTKKL